MIRRCMKVSQSFGLLFMIMLAGMMLFPSSASAHNISNSLLYLDIYADRVEAEDRIPLADLGRAMEIEFAKQPEQSIKRHEAELRSYLKDTITPRTQDGRAWKVTVDSLIAGTAYQDKFGNFPILVAKLTFTPPEGASSRQFELDYRTVVSKVETHSALVSIREDWAGGRVHAEATRAGVIRLDTRDDAVPVLTIDASGSLWTGFVGMVKLGMSHISEGTDHLLFLLTLLLPAPLMAAGRRWKTFAGMRTSLRNILKITTAFTIGHSLTLILATLIHLRIPAQPVEALIAFSIIITAVHALRPLFPSREMLVAGVFGLIHGMAFSFVLAELNLDATQLVLSLLGFNVGIELMQLIIILLTMPSLVILARTKTYPLVRIGGGLLALVAAAGWLAERLGWANPISNLANSLSSSAHWLVFALAAGAVTALVIGRRTASHPAPITDETV